MPNADIVVMLAATIGLLLGWSYANDYRRWRAWDKQRRRERTKLLLARAVDE